MEGASLNINNIKMQLKARMRVPTLIESKQLNIEFFRNFDSTPTNEINLAAYAKSKLSKSYINSFTKYSFKTNLLKRLLLNMSIKELYQEEKECSKVCKEVINEIEKNNECLELNKLPLIKDNNKFIKKKIIIKKIRSKPKPLKQLLFKKSLLKDYQNIPNLSSSSNKITSYIESTREKEKEKGKEKKILKNKSKIELEPINLFNYKQNYSIIKGGGIRYDNSIFRYKNMNDLLHF